MTKQLNLLLAGLTCLGLATTSCDDTDSVATPAEDEIVSYLGTQAPGDVWSWTINKTAGTIQITWDAGTFDVLDDDISVTADLEVLPSGFLKATNLDATPNTAEIPEDGTAYFYAFEVPGSVLVVKGEGSIKGDMIAMVSEGNCGDLAGDYHYFVTAPGNAELFDPAVEEAFGTATFTATGGGFDITGMAKSLDCLNGGPCSYQNSLGGLPTATCNGQGFLEITDTENASTVAQGQFTAGGLVVLDSGEGNGGIFATRANNGATLADLNSKSYNGLAYLPHMDGNETVAVGMTVDGAGVGNGAQYTDIETGTLSQDEAATFDFTGLSNGQLSGTVTFPDGDVSDLVGGVIPVGEQLVVVMSSFSPEAEGNNAFILILASE